MFGLLDWFKRALSPPELPPRGLTAALEESKTKIEEAENHQKEAANGLMQTVQETILIVRKKDRRW